MALVRPLLALAGPRGVRLLFSSLVALLVLTLGACSSAPPLMPPPPPPAPAPPPPPEQRLPESKPNSGVVYTQDGVHILQNGVGGSVTAAPNEIVEWIAGSDHRLRFDFTNVPFVEPSLGWVEIGPEEVLTRTLRGDASGTHCYTVERKSEGGLSVWEPVQGVEHCDTGRMDTRPKIIVH